MTTQTTEETARKVAEIRNYVKGNVIYFAVKQSIIINSNEDIELARRIEQNFRNEIALITNVDYLKSPEAKT